MLGTSNLGSWNGHWYHLMPKVSKSMNWTSFGISQPVHVLLSLISVVPLCLCWISHGALRASGQNKTWFQFLKVCITPPTNNLIDPALIKTTFRIFPVRIGGNSHGLLAGMVFLKSKGVSQHKITFHVSSENRRPPISNGFSSLIGDFSEELYE